VAFRFRKSIKLAPGIRWNLSGSGSSWNFGPRGASIGIGKRGTFMNFGIPGTGLSYRTRLGGSTPSHAPERSTRTVSMNCTILEDGSLSFTDDTGAAVSEYVVEKAKKQNRQAILDLIQRRCDEINEQIEALGRLHHDTPDPEARPKFVALDFPETRPSAPVDKSLGFFASLLPGQRRKHEESRSAADGQYRNDLADWEANKAQFEQQLSERKLFLESLIYEDKSAMERFFEENLKDIIWPRETVVDFEISDSGNSVSLDVDLPEIEDMPSKFAAVPARGLKLSVKELNPTKLKKLYAEHIHGVVFRLMGEVFAALPTVQEVSAAGYSQRRDLATAKLHDDYLLSVRATRPEWNKIDFVHLAHLDVIEALSRFDLRREMSRSGVFKPITPHA